MCREIISSIIRKSEEINNLFSSVESVATIIGIVVAGIWTYKLFVKKRESKPRLNVKHNIKSFTVDSNVLIHVSIIVNNISDVLVKISFGEVRALPMLPLHKSIKDTFKTPGENGDNSTEITWPNRESISFDWSNEPHELEPKESEEFHFDFVLKQPLDVVQIYSHIENDEKNNHIGWNTTTIHDIKSGGS